MKKILLPVLYILTLISCRNSIPEGFILNENEVKIYPDYTNTTIPYNIAALNFIINEEADEYLTEIYSKKGEKIIINKKSVQINLKNWKSLLHDNKGDSLFFQVYLKKENQWIKYPLIANNIASEAIDEYISYRLINPGYYSYEDMSLNQRNITNFNTKVIYHNQLLSTEEESQCVNCHSYQNYNKTGRLHFHIRGRFGGTIITDKDKIEKYNLKTEETISGGVYPSWHPTQNLIAYSVNSIGQNFHTKDIQKVEVTDTKSDLILFDIDKKEVQLIANKPNSLETFPYWSPDGKELFFVSAEFKPQSDNIETDVILNYQNIRYNLLKMSFDIPSRTFGKVDTVFNAFAVGKSATFPRLSPNGKYLLFTMGDYGNFHIWHKSSDLYLMDTKTGLTRNLKEVNSNDVDSYHSWSSNGSWIIFSSRRENGSYTRFYISYFDKSGVAHKPFVLPQEDPLFNKKFFKSFNIPEFMVNPVNYSRHELLKVIKSEGINVKFVE